MYKEFLQLKMKNKTRVEKDEQPEPSHAAGGNVKRCSHFGKQFGYQFFFWCDENILELGSSDGCTTMNTPQTCSL